MALRLRGKVNVPILEQTLGEILRRHEVLRATFAVEDGIPNQRILPVEPVCLLLQDLSEFSAVARESQAIQRARQEAKRSFDLAHGPLLRGLLLRLEDEEHILVLVMHQIVFDGWSAKILFKEITAIYNAFSSRDRSPLVELPIQYGDFAYWQRQPFQEGIFQAQLSYWREKLTGHPPELHLPTDHPRPPIQTYLGSRQSLLVDPSLLRSLGTLGQREGVTLFMVLLAAFQTLLHRYTSQEDILVGSPIAGRTQVETEGLIGPFINTLVLRIDLSGNPSFLELLQRVRSTTLDAYVNQDLPFERLVKELQPDRDLRRPPFFQVMFNLENLPQKAVGVQNLEIEEFEFDSGTTHFDLELEITENRQGLYCLMSYNLDLFDSSTINRLLGHYQTLLQGLANHPDQPLSELPLLTEHERHQLLVEWNDTRTHYPQELCVHHVFEDQVRRTPNAVAAVLKDRQFTYAELNCRANGLAQYLKRLGVGPEVIVGICMERSLDMMVGLLAILKSGGAYLPLDPTYPVERIRFTLEDADVPVLLTQERLAEHLPMQRSKMVRVDADWSVISREDGENVGSQVTSQNLCYVIYTSGSTGKPKGVMVCHSNVVNFFAGMDERVPHDPPGVWLAVTSLSFDISVLELLWTLGRGFKVVLCPDQGDPASIRTTMVHPPKEKHHHKKSREEEGPYSIPALLGRHRITHFFCTPSMAHMLMVDDVARSALQSLRVFNVGGEVCSIALATKLRQMELEKVINMYGPTETTICATTHLVGDEQNTVPIGRPIANTQVYILDEHLRPVPVGITGELFIGGGGVARGYLNRPDLTAERFIRNPFSDGLGSRLYRTGDLARYRQDGHIEFLGRMDHQVKIRGYRIELGEIETILEQHSKVKEVVVKEWEVEAGDVRLVAYVVSERRPSSLIAELRQFLQTKLPEYMIPSYFLVLECLPLLPNGKVDRRALPSPEAARPLLETSFVAPRDVLELQLTKMWEEVLDIRPIGVRDNFFHIGGHSLLAARVCARIGKTLGKPFPLIRFFQSPTVEQLARVLALEGKKADDRSLILIQGAGSGRPFFCVPGNLGNVFTDLGGLARCIGSDRPFYGFQDSIHNPARIEALAARYIEEIRTIQEEGPYLLGGICLGGVVAFEMAQQLRSQGKDVGLLLLVEPGRPPVAGLQATLSFLLPILRRAAEKFGSYLRDFSHSGTAERVTYARLKAKVVANVWALQRYVPKPYPGKIVLLLSEESRSRRFYNGRRLDWCEVPSARTEVHFIPGTHEAITQTPGSRLEETDLRILAEKMKVFIDEASIDVAIK